MTSRDAAIKQQSSEMTNSPTNRPILYVTFIKTKATTTSYLFVITFSPNAFLVFFISKSKTKVVTQLRTILLTINTILNSNYHSVIAMKKEFTGTLFNNEQKLNQRKFSKFP